MPVDGLLTASDAFTTPGKPARLEARLVTTGLRQAGLGGEPVEFEIAGRAIGRALTGGDGRAHFEYTPRMRGLETVTVRLAETKRVRSEPAKATVFAWERRRPIVLVEFAAILEPESRPKIPLLSGISAPSRTPVAGAADELKRLAEFYFNVIYVARAASDQLEDPTALRAWLAEQKFPQGMVIQTGPKAAALEERLDELRRQGWDHLKAGVGRSTEFAEILVRQRIPAVVVPPPDRGDVPKKAVTAKDWKEVRKKLQG